MTTNMIPAMDQNKDIKQLVESYRQKGMSSDQIRSSLEQQGYETKTIEEVLQNIGPISDLSKVTDASWQNAGNAVLKEKRQYARMVAYPSVLISGGYAGYQVYLQYWQSRFRSDPTCQSTFPYTDNPCVQKKADGDYLMIAVILGALIFLVIAKLCYYIADRRKTVS